MKYMKDLLFAGVRQMLHRLGSPPGSSLSQHIQQQSMHIRKHVNVDVQVESEERRFFIEKKTIVSERSSEKLWHMETVAAYAETLEVHASIPAATHSAVTATVYEKARLNFYSFYPHRA